MKPYLMSNFPSVRPSLNLQFDSQPTPADMTSHLASVGATFSRASIGTYTDVNGLVAEATAGQARPNYSTAGVHEGLLIEEARTNLIKSSEDFSTTDWQIFSNTLETNQIVAPDGKAGADLLTSTGANAFPYLRDFISVTSGNDVTFSLFVKQYSTDDQAIIRLVGTSLGTSGTDTSSNYKFNFSTEALTKISGGTAKSTFVEDYGNGWYRIGITLDNATITQAVIYPIFNSTTVSSVYIWGAQLEEGSFPTSYIPTIPTFSSRASVATFFDSSGVLQTQAIQTSPTGVGRTDHKYINGEWVEAGLLLEGSAENLITSSEDFSTTDWSEDGTATVTINQAIAPDGTASADLIDIGDTGTSMGPDRVEQSITLSATTYTLSAFVKKVDAEVIGFRHFQSGNDAISDFSFDTEEFIHTTSSVDSTTVENVGNGWYRISITSDKASGGSDIRIGGQIGSTVTTTGEQFYLWGVQLEAGSQPTSYFPTVPDFTGRATTGTFFNSSGVLSTASAGVARTDHKYIGGQWVEAGLLLEGASTNLVTHSEEFNNPSWTKTNATISTNSISAPDGTTTADTIEATAGGVCTVSDDILVSGGGTLYRVSFFVKNVDSDFVYIECKQNGAGNGVRQWFNISAGTIGTKTTFGFNYNGQDARIENFNNYYRISFTLISPSTTTVNFKLGISNADNSTTATAGESIYGWGAQVEQQSQPTSYIKTTGATADRAQDTSTAQSSADRTRDADSYTTATKVRSADVCYIDGTAFTDFYNQEQGTVFVNVKGVGIGGLQGVYDLGASNTNSVDLRLQSDGTYRTIINSSGATSFVGTSDTKNLNSTKLATAYKQDDFVFSVDDTNFSTDTSGNIPNAGTKLNIGTIDNNSLYYACIVLAKLIYFPRRLSDNELIKLTQ